MKNKLFVWMLGIILLMSIVTATIDVNNIVTYFGHTDNTGTNVVDSSGHYNGTKKAEYEPKQNDTTFVYTPSVEFDGVDDHILVQNYSGEYISGDKDFTVNLWHYYTGTLSVDYEELFTSRGKAVSPENSLLIMFGAAGSCDGLYRIGEKLGGSTLATCSNIPPATNTWSMFTIVRYAVNDNFTMYINGTYENSWTGLSALNPVPHSWVLGWDLENYYPFEGFLDEFSIHNESLTVAQIGELWNGGLGVEYSDLITTSIPTAENITSPLQDETVNGVHLSTWDAFANADFYNVSLINLTTGGVIAQLGNTTEVNLSISTSSYPDQNYTLNVTGCNGVGCNSSYRNFSIDNTEPGISIYYPLQDNSTVWFTNQSFTFNATATDNLQLYSVNMSCDHWVNDTVSGLGVASYNYLNLTEIDYAGVESCTFTACDVHTDQFISDWDVNYKLGSGNVDIGDKTMFTLDASISDITFNKLLDRYSFCVTPESYEDTLLFQMPESCVRIENTPFNGHWVCYDSYWVDFEPYDVEIMGQNVLVDVTSTKQVEWCFESIGALNCLSTDFTFSLINDTSAPNVTLIFPSNASNNTSPLTMNYSVSDDGLLSNCSLFVDDARLSINTTPINGSVNTFNYSNSVGYYNWTVECFDVLGQGANGSTWFFNITTVSSGDGSIGIFDVEECPIDTIPETMIFLFIFVIAFFFIVLGIVTESIAFGILAGLIITFASFFLVTCIGFIGLFITGLGIIVVLYFAFHGLKS